MKTININNLGSKTKILIIPFEIDENEQYIFKTSQYSFINQDKGLYQYKNIKYSPIVDLNIGQ